MSSVKIQGSATGTANFTIAVPDGTSTDRTIELPDSAGSFVLADASGDVTVSGAFTSQGIDDNATSTALTLDSGGKLLVGTTSSSQDAAFVATDSGAEVGFSFRNNATATNTASSIYLQSWTADSTQAGVSKISSIKDSSTYGTDLVFYTTEGTAGNTTERLRINHTGDILAERIYTYTTSGGANVRVQSNGLLQRDTSSQRYKNTINDATHGLAEVLALRPVTYKGNNDGDTVFGGLIAEEVHEAGLTEFVEYDDEDRPDALRYANMVSLCVKAIQEQQALIEDLQTRLAALEAV